MMKLDLNSDGNNAKISKTIMTIIFLTCFFSSVTIIKVLIDYIPVLGTGTIFLWCRNFLCIHWQRKTGFSPAQRPRSKDSRRKSPKSWPQVTIVISNVQDPNAKDYRTSKEWLNEYQCFCFQVKKVLSSLSPCLEWYNYKSFFLFVFIWLSCSSVLPILPWCVFWKFLLFLLQIWWV